jgi:hypothetical protein
VSVILGIIPGDRGTTQPIPAGFVTGAAIPVPAPVSVLAGDAAAIVAPETTALPDTASGAPLRGFADDFYFRVWAIPNILDAQNPKIGTPIPFKLWNAYLGSNTLNTITPTNATGLSLDIAEGTVLGALELKTVNALIGEDAPYSIDARFDFDFEDGGTALRFLASLADILPIEPNDGIIETFEWQTDILQNYDGTDQRIALRVRPRRSFQVGLSLLNDEDRKALYDKLYKTAALTVIVPSYQYQSRLKAKTVIGDNKLYTNPRRADLRENESLVIVTRSGEFFFYKIAEVFDDYVTITTSFSQVIAKGAIVAGGFSGRFPNKSSLSMSNIQGSATLTVNIIDSRDQIPWPGGVTTLPTINGKPFLNRNPLAIDNAQEAFDIGLETIDNGTGKPQYYTSWPQPFIEGGRKYRIQSLFDLDELDFWRTFLDHCRGQQRAFYTPTFRRDLVQVEGTVLLSTQVSVKGTDYATQYFGSPIYRYIQVETPQGTFEAEVSNVSNEGDHTVINFVDPIDSEFLGVNATRISYILLTRLSSDTVTLTHNIAYTTVELTLRTAVE